MTTSKDCSSCTKNKRGKAHWKPKEYQGKHTAECSHCWFETESFNAVFLGKTS